MLRTQSQQFYIYTDFINSLFVSLQNIQSII